MSVEATRTLYQVAQWGASGEPVHEAYFTDRELAEGYQAKLEGSELEELVIETAVPERVTVHWLSKYVILKENVTIGAITGREQASHSTTAHWSHQVGISAWSNGDHDVEVARYAVDKDEDLLRCVSVRALDEQVGRRALAETEQRLIAEAAVKRIADGDSA